MQPFIESRREAYLKVFTIRRAVEREFTLIAEALSRIAKISHELNSRVANVRQIASFWNVIARDDHTIDDLYVWKVVHENVPLLKKHIEDWAAKLDSGSRT